MRYFTFDADRALYTREGVETFLDRYSRERFGLRAFAPVAVP